mgnify:CR=1 FL=1
MLLSCQRTSLLPCTLRALLLAVSLPVYSSTEPEPATVATPVLLTATLAAAGRQEVTAPLSDNWQIQLQWLKPEAEPVRKGDLIAVFNAGTSQSDINRLTNELLSAKELLKILWVMIFHPIWCD